jgi:hypothetical protein
MNVDARVGAGQPAFGTGELDASQDLIGRLVAV